MTFDYPRLKIKPPKGSSNDGLPPVPYGMLSWRNAGNKYVVLACGFYSDPAARTEEWWRSATDGLPQSDIDREYLISFDTKGGAKVFPYLEWTPDRFLRPHQLYRDENGWKINRNWRIVAGLDYGSRNPTSIHIYAIDEMRRWHSIWEYYKPSDPYSIAEAFLEHPLYERLEYIGPDPSIWKKDQVIRNPERVYDKGDPDIKSVGDILVDCGINKLVKANNDRLSGLARIETLLNQRDDEDRDSHFFISDDCPNQWREFKGLIYRQETEAQLMTRNPSEDVEKKDDHTYDDARYATSVDFIAGSKEKIIPPGEFVLARVEEQMDLQDLEREGDGLV